MIVEMRRGASQEQVDAVVTRAKQYGLNTQLNIGTDKVVVALLGSDTGRIPTDVFEVLPGVASVTRIMRPYKLASREFKEEPSTVRVGDVTIGGPQIIIMAGPCSIESREQLKRTAEFVLGAGAKIVRGGAFKPRTSPFSFQGLGDEGVDLLSEVGQELCVPVISEITAPEQVDLMAEQSTFCRSGRATCRIMPYCAPWAAQASLACSSGAWPPPSPSGSRPPTICSPAARR